MTHEELIDRIVNAPKHRPERKRGAPIQQRGLCQNCGKKGLGNTYFANGHGSGLPPRAYRQCRYCSELTFSS
jgi:hypothetical protein